MRRVPVSLFTMAAACGALFAAGCGGAPPSAGEAPYALVGWPDLPATLAPDPAPPDLPAGGPVGRGSLVVASAAGVLLVLEDGRQFRLPPPPREEGSQGRTYASLSPDGRWIGHRRSAFRGDGGYLIRDLLGHAVVQVDAAPVRWSPDGRFLLAGEPMAPPSILVEPATGAVRPVDTPGATGVLGDGRLLAVDITETALRIAAGSTVREVPLGPPPDYECWCPTGLAVAPALDTVTVLLHHRSGKVPGTSDKSRPVDGNPARLVVLDRDTGTERHRVELPATEGESWALLADTGAGVLVRQSGPDVDQLVLVDPASGRRRVALRPPRDVVVAVPGQVLHDGE